MILKRRIRKLEFAHLPITEPRRLVLIYFKDGSLFDTNQNGFVTQEEVDAMPLEYLISLPYNGRNPEFYK